MPTVPELTPEQREQRRQAKIERLRMLQKQYRMLEEGSSSKDKMALRIGQQDLERRIERAEHGLPELSVARSQRGSR